MAADILEKISKDEQERIKYQEHLIWMADQYSKQESMRRKGVDEGITIGITIGIDKNKEENAINLLRLGVSEEIVAQGVGLTVDKVKELKDKIVH